MRANAAVIALSLLVASAARAQSAAADSAKTPGIEDNSFLVEEAYNQDAGVVQHISGLSIDETNKSYEYDFTQEWPVGGIRHQLSYTIPFVHARGARGVSIGDALLNYRYQLAGDGDAALAISPRFSLAFPTGDWRHAVGTGAVGYEAFLPVSIVLSDLFVTHLNAGARYTPSARNESGARAGIWKYTLGGSGIATLTPTFNLMLETIWSRGGEVASPGKTIVGSSWTISPGARMALNYKSGLQIVPGIGFPIGIGPSRGDHGVFLYLSFEHPFSDEGRKK